MQDGLGEIAQIISKAGTVGGVVKKLRGWAKTTSIYEELGDVIFVPAVLSDIAGQLMVYGREAGIVHLDATDTVTAFLDLPWDEAIKEWLARGLVTPNEFARMRGDYAQRSARARDLMLEQVQMLVRTHLETAIADGTSFTEFAKEIQSGTRELGLSAQDPAYLQTVFRTNIQAAYGAGRFRAMTDPDVIAARPYVEYRTVGDALVRDSHRVLEGTCYHGASATWHGIAPPNGFNCFPGSALVQGTFNAAIRAPYSGQLVKLTTESGRVLSVTPNHPLATPNGFAVASSIRNGQYVLSYDAGRVAAVVGQINPENAPARIEDVFDAFAIGDGASARLRPVADDFHGDAVFFQGDVDVVFSKCSLLHHCDSKSANKLGDAVFAAATPGTSCEVCCSPRHDLDVGVDATTGGTPCGAALTSDGGGTLLESAPLESLRFGLAANLDASRYETPNDGRPRDAEFVRQLLDRSATGVFADKVINVEFNSFHGFVYDVQSPYGWLVADGIVTSNCRCSMVTLSSEEAKGRDILGEIPAGGEPDEGFDGPPVATLEA